PRRTRTPSPAAGGAVAEGLGASAKAGIAAAVAVAATAGLVWALSGGPQTSPEREARPGVAQPVVPEPTPTPTATHSPEPVPVRHAEPAPPSAPAPRPSPKPTPVRTPTPSPEPVVVVPEVSESPAPVPPPTPTPSRTPSPAPSPTPSPTPPPSPAEYQVSRLPFGQFGDQSGPELRLGGSSPLWQRGGMSIGGTQYAHGVTVHPRSSVTVDLNRACSTYVAFAGLDDTSLKLGSVRFSVYGDGVRLWQSPVVGGGDPAVSVRVGIAGRATLRLVVEPVGKPFGRVALADWAEARITCAGQR
ncbi:NPCBM/NEW2 domain-containing protein, partial [Streptomyces sp. MUM 203J]|uniref:NPCBM/NEW2 domain-containing protein n=1 Tax=Streptomyces sp. MUM 203J TaxID=2791990 RepID=UPI001F038818